MKFEKPSMQTVFFLLGIAILWFIGGSRNIDPSEFIKTISIPLIAIPLILLGIFASYDLRKKVKGHYKKERDKINQKIKQIRAEQDTLSDINELIELDREIVSLREELHGIKSNRFEICSIASMIFFILTIAIIQLDLGLYLDIQSRVLSVISFLLGSYYLADMIKALFIVFDS